MENELFDFATSEALAGFRLHRLEVYNWGTFHGRVWTIKPQGDNVLLTGDIGSGKSTLVDAITTLLVPPQRITYNKAAGADARERSLRSYVLGYYKSERSDVSFGAKPISLRDHTNYSVLLAHFHNAGYHLDTSLAQVIWFRDQDTPVRLYVVADRPLTITDDFANFGSTITVLRKRLRRDKSVRLYENFRPYADDFRRRFGIESDQALKLFHQTVSMKSVGNLTDFVREHILEAPAVEERIAAMIGHFDNLDRAYTSILNAKAQIQMLEPLVADLDSYARNVAELAELRTCSDALRPWFAMLKAELLDEEIARLSHECERISGRITRLEERRAIDYAHRDDLKQAIGERGGQRLDQLNKDIELLQKDVAEKRRNAESYRKLAEQVGLDEAVNDDAFWANRRDAATMLERIRERQADLSDHVVNLKVNLHELDEKHRRLTAEIDSLRSRTSNIPAYMVNMRKRLVQALDIDEVEVPFVGELIQVRESDLAWEGAIERLMRNFGLSLLVPDRLYAQVAEWVDRNHLGGRLVYFRVREQRQGEPAVDLSALREASLVRKIAVRQDSEFCSWLEREVVRRFDYICCDDLAQFRREQRAITKAGQIKGVGERHEKDDRFAIDDRSRYVLGWNNAAKLKVLEDEERSLQWRLRKRNEVIEDIEAELKRLDAFHEHLIRLQSYESFTAIDWRSVEIQLQQLIRERDALLAASDQLQVLQKELSDLEKQIASTERKLRDAHRDLATKEERRKQAEAQRTEAHGLLSTTPEPLKQTYFAKLAAMRSEALPAVKLTVESCEGHQSQFREWLQAKIDAVDERIGRARDRIIDAMRLFKTSWQAESREMDVSVEAGDEYRALLHRLQANDLPRYEAQFKELLRENTIRDVAAFHAQLNREREEIRERIAAINRSLRSIDYNPGRYIELLAEPTHDAEIREFREALRACTEGTVGPEDDQYSEAKFLQVKAIIERFRGREGTVELDRRWTRKVTDVRNWFFFSTSEKWREDDTEYEHYTDSGGKSGGQKEKLAYTVLAASLAYQFGLEWGAVKSRSFRFVVIDEVFGRGSDESARYGLELFAQLNLQVLVVTPLQKIHVIEPYVSCVSFVHNEGGRDSKVRNLTIEEYRAEKAAHGSVLV